MKDPLRAICSANRLNIEVMGHTRCVQRCASNSVSAELSATQRIFPKPSTSTSSSKDEVLAHPSCDQGSSSREVSARCSATSTSFLEKSRYWPINDLYSEPLPRPKHMPSPYPTNDFATLRQFAHLCRHMNDPHRENSEATHQAKSSQIPGTRITEASRATPIRTERWTN